MKLRVEPIDIPRLNDDPDQDAGIHHAVNRIQDLPERIAKQILE